MARGLVVRRGLTVCYTCELVALAVWIGGLVVIMAAVIPAVFNSFGMEPGGRFLTRVFDGYNRIVFGAIVILLGTAAFRGWASRLDGFAEAALTPIELAVLIAMTVVAALIGLVLGPESVTLQEQAFTAQDDEARKAALDDFFRSHTVVRGLYGLNLGLGIALVGVKVKGWMNEVKR